MVDVGWRMLDWPWNTVQGPVTMDYRWFNVNRTGIHGPVSYGVPLPTLLDVLYSVHWSSVDQAKERGLLVVYG